MSYPCPMRGMPVTTPLGLSVHAGRTGRIGPPTCFPLAGRVAMRARSLSRAVAAQLVVALDLIPRQDVAHAQVRAQVCRPKLRLQPADLADRFVERALVDRLPRERLVQLALALDDRAAQFCRAGLHFVKRLLRPLELLPRKAKLVF